MKQSVAAVSGDGAHNFSKAPRDSIRLMAGYGVEGDAHAGRTIRYLSLVQPGDSISVDRPAQPHHPLVPV